MPEPFEDAEHTHGWFPVDYDPVDYDPDAFDAAEAGTKLTGAGYLPPLVVEQIAQAAGVTDWWIGRANREDLTWPVAILRENAQEVGLLRKAKGTLAPTARAATPQTIPASWSPRCSNDCRSARASKQMLDGSCFSAWRQESPARPSTPAWRRC